MAQIYIAGIHTDIGKTHFSIAFCKAFSYSYFKLIQAGNPTDTNRVKEFLDSSQKGVVNNDNANSITNTQTTHQITIYNEGITLNSPTSPHIAKIKENLNYEGLKIPLPNDKNCVIELAGGIYTPLDERYCMIDFMREYPRPCVLVGGYYLGSINHILLSIEALKSSKIELLCLAMSKATSQEYNKIQTQDFELIDHFISDYAGIPIVHLPYFSNAKGLESSAKLLHKDICAKVSFRF